MASAVVVDDHAGFRAQARALLERAGYAVVGEAADGTTAIRLVHGLHPDLVLLDVQLPDMSGFAVAEALAAEIGAPDVVLVSGRDASSFGGRVRDCGALGFIWKGELSVDALSDLVGGGPAR